MIDYQGLAYMLPLAETAADNPGEKFTLESDGSYLGDMLMVIVVLALVVGLIVLTIRYLARKNSSWFQARSIRHLGGIGVGQNKSVQLVKIGESLYVVGVGNDVRLLEKIDDPAQIAAIMQSLAAPPAIAGQGWLGAFGRWLENKRSRQSTREQQGSPEAHSFQELFHSRIAELGRERAELSELLRQSDKEEGTPR